MIDSTSHAHEGFQEAGRLTASLYEELRGLAARFLSRESHPTFQPTDLVNETFLKLAGRRDDEWQGRTHFLAVSASAMRCLLVDHARAKCRLKRGGRRVLLALRDDQAITFEFPDQVLQLDEILRALEELEPLHARFLELRVLGGLSFPDISSRLGLSLRTVERHWAMIRAWVLKRMDELGDSPKGNTATPESGSP